MTIILRRRSVYVKRHKSFTIIINYRHSDDVGI